MSIILKLLVIQLLCVSIVELAPGAKPPPRPNKGKQVNQKNKVFNRTAYKKMTKIPLSPLKSELTPTKKPEVTTPKPDEEISPSYINVQEVYYVSLNQHYMEAVDAASNAQSGNGFHDVEASCFHCQSAGSDKMECFANCITDALGVFQSYAKSIAGTFNALFCRPIGFKFMEQFFSDPDPSIWKSYQEFFGTLLRINQETEQPFASAVESWTSNLLLLQQSPLFLYSYLRGSMVNTILNLDTYENTNLEIDSLTPGTFAALCTNTFATDIAPDMYNLISASKDKPHFMDVVLRGLFTLKSAAFYAPNSFNVQMTGILEMLGVMIGRKCNVLAYSEGQDVMDCDELGRMPMPNFPYPSQISGAPSCQ